MGGGASSRNGAQKNSNEAKDTQINVSNEQYISPSPKPLPKRSLQNREDDANLSCDNSVPSTGSPRQSTTGVRNQDDCEFMHHRISRRSSEESLNSNENDSDGLNEENMNNLVYSAMSLGMDNDELLFNMFYFGDEDGVGLRQSMNTAVEETYAAHSTGNTPYKLRPVEDDIVQKYLTKDINMESISDAEECLICQEKLKDPTQSVVVISACKHIFHEECVLRWFTLQNWCPICRAVICTEQTEQEEGDNSHENNQSCNTGNLGTSVPFPSADFCGGESSPIQEKSAFLRSSIEQTF